MDTYFKVNNALALAALVRIADSFGCGVTNVFPLGNGFVVTIDGETPLPTDWRPWIATFDTDTDIGRNLKEIDFSDYSDYLQLTDHD